MQLPYFYENSIDFSQDVIQLSEETSKHCVQVLRMNVGAKLQLTDGKGKLSTAEIIEAHRKHTSVRILESIYTQPNQEKCTIAMALLKNNSRYEWFLEKVTELGVDRIIPLLTEHTEKTNFRWDRMNGILIAAMIQSRQTYLPILEEPQKIEQVLQTEKHEQCLIAHCEDRPKSMLSKIKISQDTFIIIGPEGDFSGTEIDLAEKQNYAAVSLGNTRLRTETAGVIAATILKLNF